MAKFALLLACLACAIPGCRARAVTEQLTSEAVQQRSYEQVPPAYRRSPTKLFANMLLASNPALAFNPSSPGISLHRGNLDLDRARSVPRRQCLAWCTWLTAGVLAFGSPSVARADFGEWLLGNTPFGIGKPEEQAGGPGMPSNALYKPGSRQFLPKVGFETILPKLEKIRDKVLPLLRVAVTAADWSTAGTLVGKDIVALQFKTMGTAAALLDRDAYDILRVKEKYASTMAQLQGNVASPAPDREAAIASVTQLEAGINGILAYVPKKVVASVREAEMGAVAKMEKEKEPEPEPVVQVIE